MRDVAEQGDALDDAGEDDRGRGQAAIAPQRRQRQQPGDVPRQQRARGHEHRQHRPAGAVDPVHLAPPHPPQQPEQGERERAGEHEAGDAPDAGHAQLGRDHARDAQPVALALALDDGSQHVDRPGAEHAEAQRGERGEPDARSQRQAAAAVSGAWPAAPPAASAKGRTRPGGELDADRQHAQPAAHPLPRGEDGVDAADHRQQHQQVVVAAADPVDHEQRVEADEGRRLDGVGAAQLGAAPHHRDQREAGQRPRSTCRRTRWWRS